MTIAGAVAQRLSVLAIGDAPDRAERGLRLQRRDQLTDGLLAFAAHDRVDMRLFAQDLAPVIGRKHAAIDDVGVRAAHRRCASETSAMTGWPEVEPEWPNSTASGRNATVCATMSAVGIGPNSPSSSRTVMAVVDQRPADREQPERRQVIVRDAAADRRDAAH